MLQQKEPSDFVIGTGQAHSVREFTEKALSYIGIKIQWKNSGIRERGVIREFAPGFDSMRGKFKKGDTLILVDPMYFRPTEVDYLLADNSKAKKVLGWSPKIKLQELVEIMMDYYLEALNLNSPGRGIQISKEKGFGWTTHAYSSQTISTTA